MKPSIGRVVRYVSYGTPNKEYASEERAAIITAVHDVGVVDLCVLNPTGMFFNLGVTFEATGGVPGSWHWPEQVDD